MSENIYTVSSMNNNVMEFSEADANRCEIIILTECKIKLIFGGFDEFLNEHDSFDLKFDLSISEVDDTKWTGANPTELNNFPVTGWKKYESNKSELDNGYQIELGNKNKFRKSKYKFKFNTDKSLFGVKSIGMYNDNVCKVIKYNFDDDSFIIDTNYFQKGYFHRVDGNVQNEDKYLYIKISIYLKLKLRFNLQGASEKYLYQKSDKKSLVIPIDEKLQYYDETKESKEKKKPKEYRTFYDLLDGDNFLLERDLNNKIFKKYSSFNSIGFKAVNYRKNLYKGDKNNFLDGDNSFKTDVETKKYFHTESIESIVFILVESKEKNYLFEQKNIIGTFSVTNKKELKELDAYKDVYKSNYKGTQFIFFKFKFDGKILKLEKYLMDRKECS